MQGRFRRNVWQYCWGSVSVSGIKKAKTNKIFPKFEKKKQAEKSTTRRLVTDKKHFVKHNDINNEIFRCFKSLFQKMDHIDKLNLKFLLQSIPLPSVTNDQKQSYQKRIICFQTKNCASFYYIFGTNSLYRKTIYSWGRKIGFWYSKCNK